MKIVESRYDLLCRTLESVAGTAKTEQTNLKRKDIMWTDELTKNWLSFASRIHAALPDDLWTEILGKTDCWTCLTFGRYDLMPKMSRFELEGVLEQMCTRGNVAGLATLLENSADSAAWETIRSRRRAVARIKAYDKAARSGRLRVLNYLLHNRYGGCTKKAMDGAAGNGYLDVVEWLHENRTEGCTEMAMEAAAKNGHLDVVQWLLENRMEACTSKGKKKAINVAAENGHLDVVQWLHNCKIAERVGCTTRVINMAAKNGHLDVVRWLHEKRTEGCTTRAMDMAAKNGHLDVVQWLHENRDEGCTGFAICNNRHQHIVEYLQRVRPEDCTKSATSGLMQLVAYGAQDVYQMLF